MSEKQSLEEQYPIKFHQAMLESIKTGADIETDKGKRYKVGDSGLLFYVGKGWTESTTSLRLLLDQNCRMLYPPKEVQFECIVKRGQLPDKSGDFPVFDWPRETEVELTRMIGKTVMVTVKEI